MSMQLKTKLEKICAKLIFKAQFTKVFQHFQSLKEKRKRKSLRKQKTTISIKLTCFTLTESAQEHSTFFSSSQKNIKQEKSHTKYALLVQWN